MAVLDKTRLIMGWQKDDNNAENDHLRLVPFTRTETANLPCNQKPVYAPTTGHIVTFSPPGPAIKLANMTPNLLHYEGSAIIIDPTGDNYTRTHSYRKAIGQDVYLIDPFNVTGEKCESLNILSPMKDSHSNCIENYFELATTFCVKDSAPDLRIQQATQIIATVFFIKANALDPANRNITAAYDFLNRPLDIIAEDFARLEIIDSSFKRLGTIFQSLQQAKSSVAHELALSWLNFCLFSKTAQITSDTTFPIEDLSENNPMTLYIIIPPDRMKLYGPLIRLWLKYITQLIEKRPISPKANTIIFLDDATQYITAEFMISITQVSPQYGLQLWSFWHNLKQAELIRYDFENYLTHNAAVIQTYGELNNKESYDRHPSLMNAYNKDLSTISAHQQFLQIRGQDSLICDRLDSDSDEVFQYYKEGDNSQIKITPT